MLVRMNTCSGEASSGFAALSLMPLLPGGGVNDLFTNRVFLAGFWAWFTAQTLKVGAALPSVTNTSEQGRYRVPSSPARQCTCV